MGWFSTKTTIYVSSVMYNLGGDYSERTEFIKFLVINNVFAREPKLSMAEALISGCLTGPAMDLRSFYRWAQTNYAEAIPEAGVFGAGDIDVDVVAGEIPVDPGKSIWVSGVEIGPADYRQWSDAYMAGLYPDLLETNWFSTIDSAGDITITFEDLSTETFTPTGFDETKTYMYARYAEATPGGGEELVNTGTVYGPFPSSGSLPDLTDFTFRETITTTGVTKTRRETVIVDVTYTDATPPTHSETVTDLGTMSYDKDEDVYFDYIITVTDPFDDTRLITLRDDLIIWQEPRLDVSEDVDVVDEDIGGGVTMTTTTTTITETFAGGGAMDYFYRTDSYEEDVGSLSDPKFFYYAYGDGDSLLDDMFPAVDAKTGYYPVIPVRIENTMLNDGAYETTMYPRAAAAYKKATHGDLADMIVNVGDNDSIADIDYSFITYGVPLNTRSNQSRRYIYEFLKEMIAQQLADASDYTAYEASQAAYESAMSDLADYYSGLITTTPTLSTPILPKPPITTLRIHPTDGDFYFYNFWINWAYGEETFHSGLGKTGAKSGELWIEKSDNVTYNDYYFTSGYGSLVTKPITQQAFKMYFQYSDDNYSVIEMVGMNHNNLVYSDKSVFTDSDTALDDTDDSSFFIPLQYEIFKRIPIMQQNQVALECGLVVFNCYVVKKTHWYETWLFKLILIIAIVLITALVAPQVLLAGGGLLGGNVAIGAALGLSGLNAAIFGAITNAIVASIVTQLISDVAVRAFGPKLGAIISAVLGFIIANPTLLAGGSAGAMAWSNLFRPENLLALTSPLAGVYTQILQGKTANTYADLQTAQEAYQKQMEEIQKLTEANLGSATDFFNPMMLTDIGQSAGTSFEASEAFLARTLLTGSDIAGMTFETVYSFVSVNLTTDLR